MQTASPTLVCPVNLLFRLIRTDRVTIKEKEIAEAKEKELLLEKERLQVELKKQTRKVRHTERISS